MQQRPMAPGSMATVPPVARGAEPRALPVSREPMTVLLVEDDDADARLMGEFLNRSRYFDYRLTRAMNQAEAIALGADQDFDFVILDYWLRSQASLPLTEDWGGIFGGLPILLVTSVDVADIQALALDCGANGYLHKNDLSPSALDAVIRTMLHDRARGAPQSRGTAAVADTDPSHDRRESVPRAALSALADVHGFTRFLSTESRDVLPSFDTAGYIELVRQCTDTLIDILRGFILRAENREKAPRPAFARADVGKVVASAALTLQHHCEAKRQTLLVSTIGGPIVAEIDKAALYQALVNLIANAIAFSPRDTTLTLVLTDMGDHFKLALSDQGVGMKPAELAKVVERARLLVSPEELAALHGIATAQPPTKGLGLAVVATIVEMHDGRFDIESRPGWGTTVTLRLPVKRPRLN
jgi:signal transduction histidine kinase